MVHSGALKIYENLDVLPRAFLVAQADPEPPSIPEMLERERSWGMGEVRILTHAPERVVVEVQADHPGHLVLTDAFYPGWKAVVDGKSVPILRAAPYFRSVQLDEGEHTVEFIYRPQSLRIGLALSGFSLLIVLLGLVWSGRRSRQRPWRKTEAPIVDPPSSESVGRE